MADRIVVMREGYVQQIGTPTEIYSAPANRFVAGFIGVPQMNFLEGRLNDGRFVFGGRGLRLGAKTLEGLRGYEGKELTLGLRPEAFSVAAAEGENTLKVELEQTEYLGAYYILYGKLAGQDITCRIDDTSRRFDAQLLLEPDLDRAHFFDKETGRAILHTKAGDSDA